MRGDDRIHHRLQHRRREGQAASGGQASTKAARHALSCIEARKIQQEAMKAKDERLKMEVELLKSEPYNVRKSVLCCMASLTAGEGFKPTEILQTHQKGRHRNTNKTSFLEPG